jgi:hypothetical protein
MHPSNVAGRYRATGSPQARKCSETRLLKSNRVPQRSVGRYAFFVGGAARRNSGVRLKGTSKLAPWAHFFVSQKIAAISSIFASSSSATPASRVPLVPPAPASLVASLIRVCRLGYFSKCGGLK